jgi:hypothetical protein
LLIATGEGQVLSFETRLDAWIDRACAIAGRTLTLDEWRDAFGDRPYRPACASEPGD